MAEALKYTFCKPQLFKELGERIQSFYPDFDNEGFSKHFFSEEYREMELKEKMVYGARIIRQYLPDHYLTALDYLEKAADTITGFAATTFPEYVAAYGLEYPERSLEALKKFTVLCSSEFGIRPFIQKYPEWSLSRMLEWTADENEHVRRLASEGCRPRLPWGMALKNLQKNPAPLIPVLQALRNDPSEYVRRSVANNLNDISKDHPDVVLGLCYDWKDESHAINKLIKHACRTLLKQGNTRAMLLFGFADPLEIDIKNFMTDNPNPSLNDKIGLSFQLINHGKKAKKIRIEYKLHYQKANGRTSPKVFQIKESTFSPGVHPIRFSQHFENLTTRKHYAGTHTFELTINGVVKSALAIELKI